MRWIGNSVPLLLLLAGCGRPGPATPPSPAVTPQTATVADRLAELAAGTLAADALIEQADTVFLPEADVIADGRRRNSAPRFAGVDPGGQVVVTSTRVDVAGNFAWALVEYRWMAPGQDRIREGRATLVFVSREGGAGWRIAAAHSSEVR
jgi:ketosteroid isomerase-like protein